VAELVDALVSGFDFVGLQGVACFGNSLFLSVFSGVAGFFAVFAFSVVAGFGWVWGRGGHGGGHSAGVNAERRKLCKS
jgi:hypothetical protein